jgi:hypothetical protein
VVLLGKLSIHRKGGIETAGMSVSTTSSAMEGARDRENCEDDVIVSITLPELLTGGD